MTDWLIPLLSVLIPVMVTGLFNIWLFNKQKNKEKDKEQASTQKIMSEAWQMVNAELKQDLARLKEDRDEIRAELEKAEERIEKLESELRKALQESREQQEAYAAEREAMMVTIIKLKTDLRKLGKTTDELKSDTGQIPTQKRKTNDESKG